LDLIFAQSVSRVASNHPTFCRLRQDITSSVSGRVEFYDSMIGNAKGKQAAEKARRLQYKKCHYQGSGKILHVRGGFERCADI
jgi:hypothetical protein